MTKSEVIQRLNLVPLPGEGGYFHQTYKSETILSTSLGNRRASTAIYYLITPESFSKLHRVKQDEVFHFYLGSPVEMIQISPDGNLQSCILGSDLTKFQNVQQIVPKLTWQGTRLCPGGEWALLGCTIAPGFEFEDLEIKSRDELIQLFPQHSEFITKFTV